MIKEHFQLIRTPSHLALQNPNDPDARPFYIDFLSGKWRFRIAQASLRKEAVARAMGCHPRENPIIVDATAGLGRDSFILASLGFRPIMLERSNILYELLDDAMQRAGQNPETAAAIQRMQLICTDAIAWLTNQTYTSQPDIIYLDPMFPERKKSASVKKEMLILQSLLGQDMDADTLLNIALAHAKKRVVVKRPKNATKIGERAANYSISGKSSRFDVYLT